MRVAVIRPITNFSMDVYAEGIITGLKAVRPHWEIIDLKPRPVDRNSRATWVRLQKAYERFLRFPKVIRQQQADIYHIIEAAEAHAVYGLRRYHKTSVVTCHDLINFYNQENLKGSVQAPLISRYLWLRGIRGMEKANQIVAVSNATAKAINQILDINSSHITTIPNGVDPVFKPTSEKQRALVRQQHNLSLDTLCLLNVGSDHPRKNVLTILKVVEKLRQQGLSVCFWKVSTDFTDSQKAFIDAHNLESCISYLGKPDQATLVDLYGAADVLVAPSLQEGFGLTLLESMAAGTPVVTSNVSAMPEVTGDAAVLINPMDIDEIVSAISHIHHDPDYRAELIRKGLQRAQQFSWQAAAERLAQVYEKLLTAP